MQFRVDSESIISQYLSMKDSKSKSFNNHNLKRDWKRDFGTSITTKKRGDTIFGIVSLQRQSTVELIILNQTRLTVYHGHLSKAPMNNSHLINLKQKLIKTRKALNFSL